MNNFKYKGDDDLKPLTTKKLRDICQGAEEVLLQLLSYGKPVEFKGQVFYPSQNIVAFHERMERLEALDHFLSITVKDMSNKDEVEKQQKIFYEESWPKYQEFLKNINKEHPPHNTQ